MIRTISVLKACARRGVAVVAALVLVLSGCPIGALTAHAATPPTITTGGPFEVGDTYALVSFTMDGLGSSNLSSMGVQFATDDYYLANGTYDGDRPTTPSFPDAPNQGGTMYVSFELTCATTYHYRVYATNLDNETGYSDDATFTTNACSDPGGGGGGGGGGGPVAPSLTLNTPDQISKTGVNVSFSLDAPGSATVNTIGIQYGRDTSYGTTAWSSAPGDNTTFGINFGGLTCSTVYHVRAFATNDDGATGYSNDEEFTTDACATTFVVGELTNAPSKYWTKVGISDDGQHILAVPSDGHPTYSSNGGAAWTEATSLTNDEAWNNLSYYSAAISGTGAVMYAGVPNDYLYVSQDSGATWTRGEPGYWKSIGTTQTGAKAVGANLSGGGHAYVSTDSGSNFTALTGDTAPLYAGKVAYSHDGSTIVAAPDAPSSGPLKISHDDGATWTDTTSDSTTWTAVAISDDGSTIVGGESGSDGKVQVSHDGGTTWSTTTSNSYIQGIAVSGSGTYMVFVSSTGLFVSGDGGANWPQLEATNKYTDVAMTDDGQTFVLAAEFEQKLYIGSLDATGPTIVINNPTNTTIRAWNPDVSWGDAASCTYNYDGAGPTPEVNCANAGADIPPPDTVGEHTLYVRGVDSLGNPTQVNMSFTYQPYGPIYTCEDWEAINGNLSGSYTLMNDIDCSTDGEASQIGSLEDEHYFTGTLDGGSHTITFSHDTTGGLFGGLQNATIHDLNIAGTATGSWVGGLANLAGSVSIMRVSSSVNVSAGKYAGGLFGDMGGESTISDSYTTGNVTGTVPSGDGGTGGIVGALDHSQITRSYSTGAISGPTNVGGLVGLNYAPDEGSISNSFSASPVSAGGGAIMGAITDGNPLLSTYFDTSVNDGMDCDSAGAVTGCTGVDGGSGSSYFYSSTNPPLSNWNFVLTWNEHGDAFPTLATYATPATAVTGVSSDETKTTATIHGSIDDLGGWTVTTRGFQYGPEGDYDNTASSTSESYGTGEFTEDLTGLTCGTTYHYRAYVEAGGVRSYGEDATFDTASCTAPVIVSVSPVDNDTDVPNDTTLSITFDEPVVDGSGSVGIYRVSDNQAVEIIPTNTAQITGTSTDTVTISLSDRLAYNTEYYVRIDDGAFQSMEGLPMTGFSDSSTWSFTTSATFHALSDGYWDAGTTWSTAEDACASECTAGVDYPGTGNDTIVDGHTVTLRQDEAAHTLTVESSGTVDMAGNGLSVSGSLATDGILDSGGGPVHFTGTAAGNVISIGVGSQLSDIDFTGHGGGWTLTNPLSISGAVSVDQGTLDLAGQDLESSEFFNNATLKLVGSESLTPSLQNSATSTVIFNAGTGSFNLPNWTYGNVHIDSDNSFFGEQEVAGVYGGPRDVATGDFDGVNGPDIVAVSRDTNYITILLRNSDGSFTQAHTYAAGTRAHGVTVADFNDDGHLDVAVASKGNWWGGGNGYVSVFFGVGDGTFTGKTDYHISNEPVSVSTADVNDDGHPDIIVSPMGRLQVMLNNGDGTFADPYTVGSNVAWTHATGDFNGDGLQDIATAGNNTLDVYLNNGSDPGDYHLAQERPTGNRPMTMKTGDFDGDGKDDIAVLNQDGDSDGIGSLYVYHSNGDGSFQDPAEYTTGSFSHGMAVSDFSRDGHLDIVVGSGYENLVTVFVNNGGGSFTAEADYDTSDKPMAIATDDFNSDGIPDMVIANRSAGNVSIYYGREGDHSGNAAYQAVADSTVRGSLVLTHGSLDLDTHALTLGKSLLNNSELDNVGDVSLTGTGFNVLKTGGTIVNSLLVNNSEGTWTLADPLTSIGSITVSQGTLNLNGKAVSAESIAVDDTLKLRGDETFTPDPTLGASSTVVYTGIGEDENIHDWAYHNLTIDSHGSSFSEHPAEYSVGDGPRLVTHADLNNDGYADLVTSDQDGGTMSVLLNNGDGTFADSVSYEVNSNPHGITLTDVNQDGYPDAVVIGRYAGIQIMLNNGDGTFTPGDSYEMANNPINVVAADLNGDEIPDLAVTGQSDNTVTIFTGNGDGTFTESTSYDTEEGPWGITVGDLNGDGSPDLAVTSSGRCGEDCGGGGGSQVSILLNNGDGTFADQAAYGVGQNPHAIELLDLNDDGNLDIVTTNHYSNTISTLINQGDGTFSDESDYETGDGPEGIALADLNGDGKQDVIVTSQWDDLVNTFINQGDGTLLAGQGYTTSDNPFGITAADFDNDGHIDIATTERDNNQVAVIMGNASGFASSTLIPTNSNPFGMSLGDFDEDGYPDLAVVSRSDYSVTIYHGIAGGGFTTDNSIYLETAASPITIVSKDFNKDGHLDLAVTSQGNDLIGIYLGAGTGEFTPAANVETGHGPWGLQSADVNGDGNLDLVVANSGRTGLDDGSGGGHTVTVALGNGDGTFATGLNYDVGEYPHHLTLADLNGDGYLDIAVANKDDGTLSVLINNGDGTFADQQIYGAGQGPIDIASGDFNADGVPDLVTSELDGSGISVMLNRGDGTFEHRQHINLGEDTFGVAVADVNGDGFDDIVVSRRWDSSVSVLLGNGDGTFEEDSVYQSGDGPRSVLVGDINADGNPDILVSDQDSNVISILKSSGGSNHIALPGDISASGNVTIQSGNLDLSGNTLSVHGNFSDYGALVANSGTVALTGGDQHINGNSTFYDLTKAGSAAATLLFEHGTTQTVSHALTLTGAADNLLTLQSDDPEADVWNIRPLGTRTTQYVSVHNSHNLADEQIVCVSNCVNGGGNTGWMFWGVGGVEATPGETSADITWNTDHTGTSVVQYGLTSSYGEQTDPIDLGGVTSHAVSLTGLLACTLYHFKTVSTDDLDDSATSDDETFITTGCPGDAGVLTTGLGTATENGGGTVSVTYLDKAIRAAIPAHFAESGTVRLQAKVLDSDTGYSALGLPAHTTSIGSYLYDLEALIDSFTKLTTTFAHPVTVSITYDPADAVGHDTSKFSIYRYDSGEWTKLDDCSTNTDTHRVSCTTTHFSAFALFEDSETAPDETPAPDHTVRNGGGGGGGGSSSASGTHVSLIATLKARLAALIAQYHTLTGTMPVGISAVTSPSVPSGGTGGIFQRNLRLGAVGEDVRQLQIFLNSHGFPVATAGTGSTGHETNVFGAKTAAALLSFQEAHAAEILVPQHLPRGTGHFFDYTRTFINNMLTQGG